MVCDITHLFPDMMHFITAPDAAVALQAELAAQPKMKSFSKERLLSPFPRFSRNIFCVGWNYLEHFRERSQSDVDLPERPIVFTKATGAIAGPFDEIPLLTAFTSQLDYEAELAVVIGKVAKNIPEWRVLDYVSGYMCANDLSARDV